jgi:hypothetical protein
MYRSEADLIMGFNCLAVAVLETESRLLAEGFMTTHSHCLLQTDDYAAVMYKSRIAYSRYFNNKYGRSGRLGEKKYFCLEADGQFHITAALNYVLRQGLHHGLSATPFGYPHCSANAFFQRELGKACQQMILPEKFRHKYLPSNVRVPLRYRMGENGGLLREDIVDTGYVEEIYISPRNFLFNMNKLTGERDTEEQRKENDIPPITIDAIETGTPDFVLKEAKIFEQGKVDKKRMTDLELCSIIDGQILPRLIKGSEKTSIYNLPESRRAAICEALWQESSRYRSDTRGFLVGKYVTQAQLRRCFCV